jgi:hypothetical protein
MVRVDRGRIGVVVFAEARLKIMNTRPGFVVFGAQQEGLQKHKV